MAVKENGDAILERLLLSSEQQRRTENAHDEKELKKAQKSRQEMNNLFANMYEDRVKGLLDEENYSMLSVKYRMEQQQLDETIKIISERIDDAEAETDDAKRWVDLIQEYSAIDEFAATFLNELIEKMGELRKFGLMRKFYLENYRRGIYLGLLLTDELKEHLLMIQEQAEERFNLLVEREEVSEQLKD